MYNVLGFLIMMVALIMILSIAGHIIDLYRLHHRR